jgi:uncharacterized protein (DUF433 family)
MPPQLDRITRDVQFGIPFIRDTGITVSEVVRQIMGGKTIAEILQKQPELEQQDIDQAMICAVSSAHSIVRQLVHMQRAPLNNVAGLSSLLQTSDTQFSDEKRLKFLASIQQISEHILEVSAQAGVAVTVNLSEILWQPESISSIISTTVSRLLVTELRPSILVNLANGEQIVKHNSYLPDALRMLIVDLHASSNPDAVSLSTQTQGDSQVTVTIALQITKAIDPKRITNFLSWNRPFITSAALIIHQHGGQLKAVSTETGVTFEFTLPIYIENPSDK